MSEGAPDDKVTEENSREAFMAAIVKLADDEAFRAAFMHHYQLWLHPPMMLAKGDPIDGRSIVGGADITWVLPD